MKFTKRITSLLLMVVMIASMVPAMALLSSAEENWKSWAQTDSRWGSKKLGTSSYTVSGSGCLVTSVTKLIIQAGLRSPSTFNVGTFVDDCNSRSKIGSNGNYAWDAAYAYGFNKYTTLAAIGNYNSSNYIDKILAWIRQGYHMTLNVDNQNHWVAVDEELSLEKNDVYIMNSWTDTSKNVGVRLVDKYPTFQRIMAYTGGNSVTPTATFDINGMLNEVYQTHISGLGTCDVYINGSLESNDCTDFYKTYPKGTTYLVTDIRPAQGYRYVGPESFSGTIGTDAVNVTMKFVNTFTITWVIDGGSETTTVSYNEIPVHGIPGKLSDEQYDYTFVGWDPEVTAATANATYTAVFTATERVAGESDWVLESEVPEGADIVSEKWVYTLTETDEGTDSTRAGWDTTGSRWEQTGTDSSYYASFPSGFDHSHSIYTSMMTAPYSANETTTTKRTVSNSQVGYIYYQWTQTISDLSKETTWHNRSINDSKTSTYNYFFAMKDTRDFSYNSSAVAYQYPGAASGGSKSSDLSAAATYWFFRTPYYRSTYTDYQKVFTYQKVTTGLESATAVTAGNGISDVKKYVKYIASYNITWNIDGKTTIESYTYGATPSHSTPTKSADAQYTYTFTGWSPAITTVTSNVTYTAQFSKTVRNYSITWSIDGISSTETYAYGVTPTPDNPVKESDAQYDYTFTGWSPSITTVTGDKTYTAQFEATPRTYTVTWDVDGVTSTETYAYGETPAHADPVKAADEQYTYTFSGWTPAISAVTGDVTYTAQFDATPRTYTVTWVIDGVNSTETYAYGETPAHADPVKAADEQYTYTFSGWTPAISAVTGDVTYTAQFEATPLASPDVTVTVVDKTTNVHAGEVTIVIRMESEVPVQGYELALDYDTDVFTFVSAEHFVDYVGAKYGYTNVTGKSGYPLVVGCALDYAAHTSGNIQLFKLTFAISDTAEAGEYVFRLAAPGSTEPFYDIVNGVETNRTSKLVAGTVTLQEYELGDANKDGTISIRDISAILGVLAGAGEEDLSVMDVNSDGILSIRDISALLGILSDNV